MKSSLSQIEKLEEITPKGEIARIQGKKVQNPEKKLEKGMDGD